MTTGRSELDQIGPTVNRGDILGGYRARSGRLSAMVGTQGGSSERPALFFADAEEFRQWLAQNHETASELWMGFKKKHVPDQGLTWKQAVPEALCYGWIDSLAQGIDADTSRQRWTPRKKTSVWSTVNINLVAELTAAGRMQPAGIAAFEARRADRSGVYAYEQPHVEFSPEFAARLAGDEAALSWFDSQAPGYRKICINWVMSAKRPQTRESRMATLIEDCTAGRKIKSQRY